MPIDMDFMENARQAYKRAMKTNRKQAGDPDVELYKSLTNDDFGRIVSKYGVSETSRYIEEMEKLLRKGKK